MKALVIRKGRTIVPATEESLKSFYSCPENDAFEIDLKKNVRPRSWLQLKWIHAVLRDTAAQIGERYPKLNTLEKLKHYIKIAIRFFKGDFTEYNGVVHVALRSFSYDDLDDPIEANGVFDQVKNECAELLGCDPAELEARAKR